MSWLMLLDDMRVRLWLKFHISEEHVQIVVCLLLALEVYFDGEALIILHPVFLKATLIFSLLLFSLAYFFCLVEVDLQWYAIICLDLFFSLTGIIYRLEADKHTKIMLAFHCGRSKNFETLNQAILLEETSDLLFCQIERKSLDE